MKIQQLTYFCGVVKYGSVSLTAKKLFVSQPAISLAIKSLEEEFDCQLFERSNNAMVLTQEGRYFHSLAVSLLEHFDSAKAEMESFVEKSSSLKIGIPPMIGTFIFPDLLDGFSKAHPEVTLRLSEFGSSANQKAVSDKEIDVALTVIANNIKYPDLEYIPMAKTKLLFAVAKGHPLSKKASMSIKDINATPIILMKEDCLQHQLVREAFAKNGILPNIKLTTNQLYTIQEMILRGEYGAFLFEQMVRPDSQIVGIPFEKPIEFDIVLCYRKKAGLNKAAKSFINFVKKTPLEA